MVIARVVVWLVIAAIGLWLLKFSHVLSEWFDTPGKTELYRMVWFGIMVIGFIYMFGLLETNPDSLQMPWT